ncbi:uncharacterized protein [Typha latifolia]|uniref:uncharacterized protein isoform X1 n=1 Tax=Typha latifolia TaxID=4733 RepID=UPI003C2D4865
MEERGGGGGGQRGGAGGPERRSLRRSARPAPYSGTPRRWLSKLLTEPYQTPLLETRQDERLGVSIVKSNLQNKFIESKEPNASAEVGSPSAGCKGAQLVEGNPKDANHCTGLAEMEQYLKQRLFSRDEAEHMLELLRSRTPDLYNEDRCAGEFAVKAIDNALVSEGPMALTKYAGKSDRPKAWMTCDSAQNVGSSPVEIAKAYMRAQTSAYDYGSQGGNFKVLESPVDTDSSASKLFFSSATKSPICWPGAVVQSNKSHVPQSKRGRLELYSPPRAPYSGAIFSRSTSKFRGSSNSQADLLAGQKQQLTPLPSANKRKKTLDYEFTSVGPIHRIHSTASGGAHSYDITGSSSLAKESSDAWEGFLSTSQETLQKDKSEHISLKPQSIESEKEVSRYAVGYSSVHPQSSETAKKILKHLERALPSPVGESLEWKKDVASVKAASVTLMMDSQDKLLGVTSSTDNKPIDLPVKDTGYQESADAKKGWVSSSSKETTLGLDNSKTGSEVSHLSNSFPHSGCKLVSTSISSSKPSEIITSSFSFTFPIPVASNALTEPPTPTIISQPAANNMASSSDEDIPTFNFGSSRSGSRLVFSFGSVSNSLITDMTTPKFKFGSDEKRSLSFSLVGHDATCY